MYTRSDGMKRRRDWIHHMLVETNHEKHLVMYWLSKAESKDASLNQRIKDISRENKQNGYLTVVFMSGEEDLEEKTLLLLKKAREDYVKRMIKQNGEMDKLD